jgi:hypothetical protein
LIKTLALTLLSLAAAFGADASGKWNMTATMASGRAYKLDLALMASDGKWTGTLGNEEGTLDLVDVKVENQAVSFKVQRDEGIYLVSATVSGNSMKGSVKAPDKSEGTVEATRAATPVSKLVGRWNVVAKFSAEREVKAMLELSDNGGKLGGTVATGGDSAPIEDVKLEGDLLSFKVSSDAGAYKLKLTVADSGMTGTVEMPNGSTGQLSITR